MIKLSKGKSPKVLEDNSANWTNELLALLAEGQEPSSYQKQKYNHPDVKEALTSETDGKCAYCESKILHIDFGDIEHILPKSERPELWFNWENLTIACGVCNNRKRAYFNEDCPLLDPYDDEPEDRVLFFGPFARPLPGDDSALMTERQLDLNRDKLIERRLERIDGLLKQAAVMAAAGPQAREVLKEDFLRETENGREYASLARTVARHLGFLSP